jgi:hypothetical protein
LGLAKLGLDGHCHGGDGRRDVLKAGVSLMHVIAMTKALGQAETEKGAQPEVFSWRDGSQSVVRCVFEQGKLQSWTLDRPFQATDVEPVSHAAND